MKIQRARVKYGKLIAEVYYRDLKKARKAIVLSYGLLSSPPRYDSKVVQTFATKNFFVWCPHYYGTYESFGTCNFENAATTLFDAVKAIKLGKGTDLWSHSRLKWKIKEVILAGASFGGSASIVAGAKSNDVKNVIALAAPADWKRFEPDKNYFKRWKAGWSNTWRCSSGAWKNYYSGNLDLNAVDYVGKLKGKNILLIHGVKDKIVPAAESISLYDRIKDGKGRHKLILTKDEHFGIDDLANESLLKQTMQWLGGR